MGNRQGRRATARIRFVIALVVLLVLTVGTAAWADTGSAGAACKRGGWRHLTDVTGQTFKNQGRCVTAAVHGRLGQPLNPQVTGPFNGTTTMSTGTCAFQFQEFDGTYSTPSGPGSFHIEGCVVTGNPLRYQGSFTLTAPAGGTVSGPVIGTFIPVRAIELDFTLTVAAATGSLSGASGSIHFLGEWHLETAILNTIDGTLTGNLTHA